MLLLVAHCFSEGVGHDFQTNDSYKVHQYVTANTFTSDGFACWDQSIQDLTITQYSGSVNFSSPPATSYSAGSLGGSSGLTFNGDFAATGDTAWANVPTINTYSGSATYSRYGIKYTDTSSRSATGYIREPLDKIAWRGNCPRS